MRPLAKIFPVIMLLCLITRPGALIAATDYPNRAITMIVPYPAGGVTDLGARTFADALEKHLKQPVIVVNKVGGGTTIGGYAVASAKPDGYTLGFFPPFTAIPEAYTYFQEAPYTSKDLRPICSVVETCQSFIVKEDAPWNSLKELVEYARKNPGMKAGSGGKQTQPHMLLTTLNRIEKTGFVGIPFAGDPQKVSALLGDHISVGLIDYSVAKSLVDAKKLKALAVVTEKRVDFAPNVPTFLELGYPLIYVSILGVNGPKGLPDEIVQKIDYLVAKICTEQDFQTKNYNTTLQINYQDSATYQKSLEKFKTNVPNFFKEEGLVK